MDFRDYCTMLGYTSTEIQGRCRRKELVEVRKNIAFTYYRKGLSQSEIANILNRTQQAISHYISKY